MLIGTEIESQRSKRQQILISMGPENSDSGTQLSRKQAQIALRPRRFEIHHKFHVKRQEKPYVLKF